MRRSFLLVIAVLTVAAARAGANAQAPGAPLQLNPPANLAISKQAPIPKNWKFVDSGRDPFTEKPIRLATTPPKPNSSHNAKLGSVALRIECVFDYTSEVTRDVNKATQPAVVIAFAALSGIRNYKKFSTRFRFDEGPIYNLTLASEVGNNGMRGLILPTPITQIAAATEFRAEVDLHSAGIVYLDFDVSGAATVIDALACK